jgi:hypothetical protein
MRQKLRHAADATSHNTQEKQANQPTKHASKISSKISLPLRGAVAFGIPPQLDNQTDSASLDI